MKVIKNTGAKWCDELDIAIEDDLIKGFGNIDFFEKELITKEEFLNRVSHCRVAVTKSISRREAARMRNALMKS